MFDIIGFWAMVTAIVGVTMVAPVYFSILIFSVIVNQITQDKKYGEKLLDRVYVENGNEKYIIFNRFTIPSWIVVVLFIISLLFCVAGIIATIEPKEGRDAIGLLVLISKELAPAVGLPAVLLAAYVFLLPYFQRGFQLYLRVHEVFRRSTDDGK